MTHLRKDSQSAVLRATRHSQAWVIAAVDRLARDDHRPRPLGRLWRLQLAVAAALVGEPTEIVDQTYGHLEGLVALQREFGQRLLDTVDDQEGQRDSQVSDDGGQLIPFVRRADHSG
jgi:hypothetical protein